MPCTREMFNTILTHTYLTREQEIETAHYNTSHGHGCVGKGVDRKPLARCTGICSISVIFNVAVAVAVSIKLPCPLACTFTRRCACHGGRVVPAFCHGHYIRQHTCGVRTLNTQLKWPVSIKAKANVRMTIARL